MQQIVRGLKNFLPLNKIEGLFINGRKHVKVLSSDFYLRQEQLRIIL